MFIRIVKSILAKLGFEIKRISKYQFPVEIDPRILEFILKSKNFTMTSEARLAAFVLSVKYINENKINGDFVECGVWAGGSIATAIFSDNLYGGKRKYWLFDTFEGMTEPSEHDPVAAHQGFLDSEKTTNGTEWCRVSLEEVQTNFKTLNLNIQDCEFIKGDVLITLKSRIPDQISILRLDTDWYESTKFELEVLFPRLVEGGILIIDDYGYWSGARKAVDKYFESIQIKPLLVPIDHTGRIYLKK